MGDWLRGSERLVLNYEMMSKDISFEDINKNPRRVLIVNPKDAVNLRLMDYAAALQGTGHTEWEYMLAFLLVNSIRSAAAAGDEADVSEMFDRSYTAKGKKKMTANQILDHCMKIFTVVEDSPEVLKLRIKVVKAA